MRHETLSDAKEALRALGEGQSMDVLRGSDRLGFGAQISMLDGAMVHDLRNYDSDLRFMVSFRDGHNYTVYKVGQIWCYSPCNMSRSHAVSDWDWRKSFLGVDENGLTDLLPMRKKMQTELQKIPMAIQDQLWYAENNKKHQDCDWTLELSDDSKNQSPEVDWPPQGVREYTNYCLADGSAWKIDGRIPMGQLWNDAATHNKAKDPNMTRLEIAAVDAVREWARKSAARARANAAGIHAIRGHALGDALEEIANASESDGTLRKAVIQAMDRCALQNPIADARKPVYEVWEKQLESGKWEARVETTDAFSIGVVGPFPTKEMAIEMGHVLGMASGKIVK